ncbi:sulfite exporter TauE/SafE family protein [Nesterenkonia sp. MY13]|uniref:Probable membrane transporter protein n=1 Tax=Nesterenkonia sedimenti TaxID=1463632 RepID=A0A7X8THM6_9MICC|nr:sulfite exporter TauE/SafE family protein [Nesterenkonia sedimenti]NLS08580.1 sulfite exporter TauE/SafE family protein [Nesterenkonia sedimenti]
MEAVLDFELHGLGIGFLLLILLAAVWAGAINTVVGSGTLVTFPVLVAMGVPPVSATVSNAMGLIAGNFTGAWGYRREIVQVKPVLAKLVPASFLGGVIGATLLITLPEEVFGKVAPVLIVISLIMVLVQPRLSAWVKRRAAENTADPDPATPQPGDDEATVARKAADSVGWPLILLVFLAGIYGGYFVAAQGILLMAVLGIFLAASIQQANGVKNLLVAFVNLTAAISYIVVDYLMREPDDRVILWGFVAIIAAGSTFGGLIGAWVGRRLSPVVLRSVIIILGLIALAVMLRNLFV